ncbi:NACHT, LRR and PYD domains-containing protein 1 homolog [Carassius gibelio]|uniref:NACHT, LRR and PYD domains-containing protein 1 homolog n=1 Tax=Carassius gibelio TaxID=101364 RepID=UPI002279DE10|nr:NACHT, LRR and PYD domains-containing protein 1 homolog [Carassius gibelio]XP_052458990.1 NACHT, LRR and PYD domains-containing protein 1 homolog [Carassius gibelio]
MAKPATLKSCKELEQLLNGYTEQIEKLCRLYDVQPKRNKDQKKRIKAAAKELRELLVETEDRSFDVSSILGIIESGTEMIKKTIGELEIDSDVVQPCRVSSMHRVLGDTQKKMISSGAIKHNHKMMRFMKDLKTKQKPFPAIQELFQEETSYKLRTAYNKMGIDTKGCESCALEDDSEWEVKTPSEVTAEANIKYSVSTSAGQYECSETGLRWRSDTDVRLEYRFVDWESMHEDIMKNYKPCGPLMDITVTSGSLEEIHLPHFICVDSGSSSDDAVKALHVNGSEASLKRCELTRSHAKLLNPTFSLLGIIAHLYQYLTMKFHCVTLIYRNRTSPLSLHVYLILNDEKLKKDVKEKEKKNTEIVKPTPNEALKIDKFYTLKTSCDSKINPQDLKLTPCKANFFDLYIQDGKKPIELYIEDKEDKKIWEVNIESDEFSINSAVCHRPAETAQKRERCKNCKGAEFVEKHRAELIRKVSLVAPIADDMKDLIGDEKYQIILKSGTPQERMRKLLGFLTTTKLKEKLYQSLLKHERFLVEELQHCE